MTEISDETKALVLGALACQPDVAFGSSTVTGVIIPDNGGWDRDKIALVQLDSAGGGPAGKMHMRVRVSPNAQAAAGFANEAAYQEFLADVRLERERCLFGTFRLEPGEKDGERWATVVEANNVRPATQEEIAVAFKARLNNGIAAIQVLGIKPSISADELMVIMRDNDDDPGFAPRA